MRITRAIIAITILLNHPPAFGQAALVLAKFKEWNAAAPVPAEPILLQEVRNKAGQIYAKTPGCAAQTASITKVQAATSDRFAFNALIRGAIRNAWFVTTSMPACDPAPVRFMVIQLSDQDFRTIRVNRGTSYAWDSLIGDTLVKVQVLASVILERKGVKCSSEGPGTLGVIRIASQSEDLGPDTYGARYVGQWSEIWPIEVCQRTVEISVQFTADGDGGAYLHVSEDSARILP